MKCSIVVNGNQKYNMTAPIAKSTCQVYGRTYVTADSGLESTSVHVCGFVSGMLYRGV